MHLRCLSSDSPVPYPSVSPPPILIPCFSRLSTTDSSDGQSTRLCNDGALQGMAEAPLFSSRSQPPGPPSPRRNTAGIQDNGKVGWPYLPRSFPWQGSSGVVSGFSRGGQCVVDGQASRVSANQHLAVAPMSRKGRCFFVRLPTPVPVALHVSSQSKNMRLRTASTKPTPFSRTPVLEATSFIEPAPYSHRRSGSITITLSLTVVQSS